MHCCSGREQVQKEDGARENVGSLLDLGTAAAAHFCQSVLYPAQIIFRYCELMPVSLAMAI